MFSRIGLLMWKLLEQASDLTKHIYLRKKKSFFFFSLCIPQTPALPPLPPPPRLPHHSHRRNPWSDLVDI